MELFLFILCTLLLTALVSGTYNVYKQSNQYRAYVATLKQEIEVQQLTIKDLRSKTRCEHDIETIASLRNKLMIVQSQLSRLTNKKPSNQQVLNNMNAKRGTKYGKRN